MTKYEEIAASIADWIAEEQMKPDTRLPGVEQLMDQYSASKSTITRVLSILEQKGLIYQVQGSGIFVRQTKREGYITFNTNEGFTDNLNTSRITSKVIDITEQQADDNTSENLKIRLGDPVYCSRRIRYIDGKPLCFEKSYYPKKLVPYLNREILQGSVFRYFREALRIKVGFSETYMEIKEIGKESADLMNMKSEEKTAVLEQIYHSTRGDIFDYSILIYFPEQAKFYISR